MRFEEQPITRRDALKTLARGTGAALLGLRADHCSAEPPPETTRIRILQAPIVCIAPQYVAEQLLHAEGFTEVQYVEPGSTGTIADEIAHGSIDIGLKTAAFVVSALEAELPISVLAGIHAGCYELFGNDKIKTIRDLKGRSVAVSAIGASEHVFLSSMVAFVGMNPRKDINWVVGKTLPATLELYAQGKADAFLAFAPQPQELRARRVGHVIVNTTHDRPWSQYFCCLAIASREFVTKYPVASKRALRALLKAVDLCAEQPEQAARYLSTKGYERYERALEVLRELPYRRWREADPEDTLRFHALRLREGGMIKSDPNQLVARGTDWRFLNELKKELKG